MPLHQSSVWKLYPIHLSEKLIPIQQTARRDFPAECDLIAHRRENLKLNLDVILEKVRKVQWSKKGAQNL
jgi:hypothetical protein